MRLQDDQIPSLTRASVQSAEVIEKQRALIANLESLKAEQKKTLTEMSEEISTITARYNEAAERAE